MAQPVGQHGLGAAMSEIIAAPPKLRLRPYQVESVTRIREAFGSGRRRVAFQLPTGGGKTVIFSYILAGAVKQRGKRVLVLAHRQEILDQIEAAVKLAGAPYGIIAAGHPETDAPVQIARVATLARSRRLKRWRDRFDFIVIDEAHHAVAGSWARVLESQPRAQVLGVTATPERFDGRGLEEQFDGLVIGPSTADLIAWNWLAPFTVFEPAGAPDMSTARIRAGDYAVEDIRAAIASSSAQRLTSTGASVPTFRRSSFA
jgi:DNA repair protein RadD